MNSTTQASTESVFVRRARLFESICGGKTSQEVLSDLLPLGEGLLYEKAALSENLDKCASYAAFWKATNWVLVAAKRCAFSSR